MPCPRKGLQRQMSVVDITISYRIHGWHKNCSVPLSCISFPLHSYKKTTPSQSHSDNQKQGVIEQVYISRKQGVKFLKAGTPLSYPYITHRPLGSHRHPRAKVNGPYRMPGIILSFFSHHRGVACKRLHRSGPSGGSVIN